MNKQSLLHKEKTPAICKEHIDLENRLMKELLDRSFVDRVTQDVKYPYGQLDVYSIQNKKHIYYEIKRTYSKQTVKNTKKQALRWLEYQSRMQPRSTSYVIMYTTTKIRIIGRYKNGEIIIGGKYV